MYIGRASGRERVYVIAMAASRCTIVVAVAILFVPLVSPPALVAVTVAVLTIVPWVAGAMWAPMLNVRFAPAASAPNVFFTQFGAFWLPTGQASASVVSGASVSVTVPPLEVEGPLLVTVTV